MAISWLRTILVFLAFLGKTPQFNLTYHFLCLIYLCLKHNSQPLDLKQLFSSPHPFSFEKFGLVYPKSSLCSKICLLISSLQRTLPAKKQHYGDTSWHNFPSVSPWRSHPTTPYQCHCCRGHLGFPSHRPLWGSLGTKTLQLSQRLWLKRSIKLNSVLCWKSYIGSNELF